MWNRLAGCSWEWRTVDTSHQGTGKEMTLRDLLHGSTHKLTLTTSKSGTVGGLGGQFCLTDLPLTIEIKKTRKRKMIDFMIVVGQLSN